MGFGFPHIVLCQLTITLRIAFFKLFPVYYLEHDYALRNAFWTIICPFYHLRRLHRLREIYVVT
jgi:hypothetical protein